jgi:hypothetical protein
LTALLLNHSFLAVLINSCNAVGVIDEKFNPSAEAAEYSKMIARSTPKIFLTA